MDLNKRNHYAFIALMEPFQDPSEIDQYKRKLGFDNAGVNCSRKNWYFWRAEWEGNIILDTVQQVTIKFRINNRHYIISVVYARCNTMERLELWDELEGIVNRELFPWVIGGDFNVILNEEEKLGGLPFTQNEAIDFASFISSCALTEVQTIGSKYTWWNGRIEVECIFKRLDRILVNQDFLEEFPSSEVHHLIRQGSDHAPLHLICKSAEEIMVKPFRFLNFWRKHKNFKKIVAENWIVEFAGNPFIEFHAKMKKVKKALTGWSKEAFGNIFQQIATMEDVIKVKKDQLEIQPSASNRADLNKVETELKKFLRLEEEFWRQKAGMKWFTEGDMNTKFFHSYVKGRRKRLHIAEIVTEHGITLTSNDQIGQAALEFFGEQFQENDYVDDYAMLDHIPRCITNEENDAMCSLPTNEEVKKVVFKLKGSSACGPDGFTGHFYQDCWEIIGEDSTKMVKAFFCGQELTRFITHTNLVLLPKKETVKHFSDLRPISLSTFMNKILSRLIHERMVMVLPKLISPTQSGFVRGRSITENVLLAQEIIRDINRRAKNVNVVVKLDMAKAYDRVSWIFLTKGDPLSPTLFIIAAEVLARALNSLHKDDNFKGYGMPKWSPEINHLSYADDTILFCSGDRVSVIKMMKILKDYEAISGQMINKSKSFFYLHDKTPLIVAIRMRRLTGIRQGNFPFIYLGFPVFYGRNNSCYYEELIRKIAKRIFAWHNRFLSFGGKQILVNSVLQSLPIYMLSAMNPPKRVMEQIHQIFAKFFWGKSGGVKGKHWVAWRELCFPKEEGGIGFRSLHDINKALFAKLWWNFTVSTNSLWAGYLWNKYCKKLHPIMVNSTGASHIWRKMVTIREKVEHDIWWQIKAGNSSFWFDNWTRKGALYYTEGNMAQDEKIEVKDFTTNGVWNEHKLKEVISEEMVLHITKNIRPPISEAITDKAWWTQSMKGEFTVKSAFHNLRGKKAENEWSNYMWVNGLPYKISFFLWRVWGKRIATDDNLKRMRMQVVSKCYCCERGEMETMSHLLLTATIAQKLWKQFSSCVGININGLTLKQLIYRWWELKMSNKLDQILKAIPAIIMWELWKRRNAPRDGWITCNTDGASKGNPGQSTYGFCLRDSKGDLIYAEAQNLGITTNMEAEAKALWEALQYCIRSQLNNIQLETDSLVLKNMIYRNWRIPWELAEIMDDIHDMLGKITVNVQHIFREKATQLADFIANSAINTEGKQIFLNFQQLPSRGRKLLNIDKLQVPSFRIKTRRISNTNYNGQHD
ncbi:hypothetical protein MTR67_018024 [Solanum verrucosum]|uniref:RNase H type-1 domain-containing protein n=1 Tax=Solanum verrucosum TaxID=315347 RepID=A0AAF0TMB9_SOLVR|nr:hypothetical protein MTR67_018024 [Solanum verrucosum]